MIFDQTLIFSDGQAITGTAASTNVIDLGATGTPFGHTNPLTRDIGIGTKVPLYIYTTATFNTLTSLKVTLEVSADEAFTTPKEVASKTYALAELGAGEKLAFPDYVPEGADMRYMRLNYTVGGVNPTTGAITAGVVAARQTNLGDHYL